MCACINRVNEKLAEYNGVIETNLLANPQRTMVSVCKLDQKKRGKPPLMEASHCPFCGERYKEIIEPVIVTRFAPLTFGDGSLNWEAFVEGGDDQQIGFGSTSDEAIANLKEQLGTGA